MVEGKVGVDEFEFGIGVEEFESTGVIVSEMGELDVDKLT